MYECPQKHKAARLYISQRFKRVMYVNDPCSVCSDVSVLNWRRLVHRADSSSWPRSQWSAASGANASGTTRARTPSAACSERDSQREPRPAHGSRLYGPETPGTLRHTETDGFMRENWTEGLKQGQITRFKEAIIQITITHILQHWHELICYTHILRGVELLICVVMMWQSCDDVMWWWVMLW